MKRPVETRQVSYDLIFRALHDLQAPARHARSFLSMFRDSIDETSLSADSIELLDATAKATDEMRDRFASILSVLSVPTAVEAVSTIDLAQALELAWEGIERGNDADASKITIDGSGTIDSDESLVGDLLASILDNSFRFRKPDEPLRIGCDVVPKKDDVVVTITDNGSGIAPDQIDWFRQPFHRGQHHSGLGLGLTRCECITETIGCQMTIHSDGTSGTTTTLLFPKQIRTS